MIIILYIACCGLVIWQLWGYKDIINSNPTTMSQKLVETNHLPLAFTFCKMFYDKSFDGNFSSATHKDLKTISISNNDSIYELHSGGDITYDFVSYIENKMMCKEFDLTDMPKEKVELIRDGYKCNTNQNKNFYLYIHHPGMFYKNEFVLNYPHRFFCLGIYDEYNPEAMIKMKKFDFTMDPHFPCLEVPYDDCINKAIIMNFNASFGCTYPIQR